jgi:hypothetical protein
MSALGVLFRDDRELIAKRHSAQAEAYRGLVVFAVVVCMLVCPFVCAAAEMLGKVAVAATAEP